MNHYDRVKAIINLDHIEYNLEQMKQGIEKTTKILAVVKADGYGHGAIPIARHIEYKPYLFGFAVATPEEALQLLEAGIHKPILILGYAFPYSFESLIHREVRLTVFGEDTAIEIANCAKKIGKTAFVHIKVDTGMNRIGILPNQDGLDLVKKIKNLPGIVIEGVFTHFAKADEKDKESANNQIKLFEEFTQKIERETGQKIPYKHCSNSAGIIELKHANMDLVRAGITMYGLWPSQEVSQSRISLKPVLSLKSKIIHLKTVPEGTQVSYGGTFSTSCETKIATIPVGYGDGYPRSLSNKGSVIIKGKRAPIIGRICMDQFMVDVTKIQEVSLYDEVTLIGLEQEEKITMEELGFLSERFNYEFACNLGKRIPREYISCGSLVEQLDYFG